MGESAVLVHSYSFAAPITRNDSHEDNTMHALSQSISFGKFVTENLEWGKWSSFSHRKYVEEAEKYSRPGSVAQKKAFFEAHYKRIAEAKRAATQEEPTVTPAQILLHTLEETQPNKHVKDDDDDEEVCPQRRSLENGDDLTFEKGDEEKEKTQEEDPCIAELEKPKRPITKNRPVFRLSLEKTIPPNTTEIALSEKQSERQTTQSSEMKEEEVVHRHSFNLFNCFMGTTKTQDQRKKTKTVKKKPRKQFMCFCLKPKTVRE